MRTPALGTAAPGELPALDDYPDQRIPPLDNLRTGAPTGDGPGSATVGGTSEDVVRRVERSSGMLASRAAARMSEVLPWFPAMSASHRAGIQLVVQAGISSFVEWCRRPEHARELSEDVFRVAPRELVRAVTFRRLVDLVRVAVEAIEAEVPNLAGPEDELRLLADVLRYSRDIAFAGAVVYARAAEERGAWDARLEALVVDHVVRGEVDRALPSRAAAVGWRNPPAVTVIVGGAEGNAPEAVVDEVHRLARAAQLEVLAGVHHNRLVMVVGGRFATSDFATSDDIGRTDGLAAATAAGDTATAGGPSGAGAPGGQAPDRQPGATVHTALDAARALLPACGPGPVVVGPVVADLTGAPRAARVGARRDRRRRRLAGRAPAGPGPGAAAGAGAGRGRRCPAGARRGGLPAAARRGHAVVGNRRGVSRLRFVPGGHGPSPLPPYQHCPLPAPKGRGGLRTRPRGSPGAFHPACCARPGTPRRCVIYRENMIGRIAPESSHPSARTVTSGHSAGLSRESGPMPAARTNSR
ncbi:hypothetical protein [Frankia alni]|uniref:CdaR GGDEF-like domain-containing protein n=1 Tax=Frankia alni (strain DSM 45986 / CECT 9034 / ACN14a) TaxID=326424 RepID=Q0RE15_FRAAA|nr:hypothetical protein FRAAL5667 [Frankia alni ACN14a]